MKADYSPNQIFYGKRNAKQSINIVLGMDLVKVAQNEEGLEASFNLMPENNSAVMIPNVGIIRFIKEAEQNHVQVKG